MAFTVSDFEDLERLLAEHPEWRARLRPLILGDELLRVPEQMNCVGDRLDRIEEILDRMADNQDDFNARMAAFVERQDAFEARMVQLDEKLAALTEEVTELTRSTRQHEQRLNRMDGRMGNVEGQLLEIRYHRHFRNWLGKYLMHVELVSIDDLAELQSAVDAGRLSAAEVERLRDAELVARGVSRDDGQETIIVMEVSQTINADDIERANERALTLRRAGYNALAMAGGSRVAEGLEYRAEQLGVLLDLHRTAA